MDEQELKDGSILYKDVEFSEEETNMLDLVANRILEGKLILFLGAAVNCPSPKEFKSVYSEGPPMGHQLAEMLSDDIKYSEKFPDEKYPALSKLAQYYEYKADRQELVNFLQEKIGNKKPSPLLFALADMPFKQIITTNYDTLFEEAMKCKKIAKTPLVGIYTPERSVVTTDFKEEEITEATPFLYKMHGDLNISDSIVISDEDYIDFILRMNDKEDYNPIPHSFTRAFGKKTILFIGYGLLDYNLRALFKSAMWGKDVRRLPKNCSIDMKPDKTIMRLFDRFYSINFIVKDAWKVVPVLYKKVKNKEMPLQWDC